MMKDIIGEIFKGEPKGALFHYTSYDGLIGILKSKNMWLTDYLHLNDEMELKDFKLWLNYDMVGRHERYMADTKGENLLQMYQHPKDSQKWKNHNDFTNMQAFQSWLNLGFGQEKYASFIGSFSENGNLLSQWRGYCPYGNGVSLGFLPNQLHECAKSEKMLFGKCVYSEKEKRELASKVMDRVISYCRDKGLQSENINPFDDGGFFSELEPALLTVASLVKHESFAEECEWRVVRPAEKLESVPLVEYRRGKSTLVPYVDFKLPLHSSGKVYVNEIFVGPTPNEDLAMRSLVPYMRDYSYCKSVWRTRSPYKQ